MGGNIFTKKNIYYCPEGRKNTIKGDKENTMKKEETEVGSWKPARIPGPNRPLESHYGQTLLQHFPKAEEREDAGNGGVGGYVQRLCTRACVCTHTACVHFRLELIKPREKKKREKKHEHSVRKGNM